jgi:glycosyltransferase involved in cell wall biosynthesis
MIDSVVKYQRTSKEKYQFSVLIPSWNNVSFLQLCVESILGNSHFEIQIIVIVNEGKDETIPWLEQQGNIDFLHAKQNIGICYALNLARSMVKSDYIVYANDDMYLLPNWDLGLFNEINSLGTKNFMLSCTMIEPTDTGNACVIVKNYGQDIASFQKEKLLTEYESLQKSDWSGSTWPPNVVHIDMWDMVGGLSIEYSPGMYSDPDFAKKLYDAGVGIFKGKGTSLVYHFGSKSTKRVKKNKGRATFLLKWGITSNTFMKKYLHIGTPYQDGIKETQLPKMTIWINKIKRMMAAM